MSYILPSIPYLYDSLEPYFDKETMKIHHTKHHQTYVNNINLILEKFKLPDVPINELFSTLDTFFLKKNIAFRNNAGGHFNHSFFWKGLKIGTLLQGELKEAIQNEFSSIDAFKMEFEKVALSLFGSGWVWLIYQDNVLSIVKTHNQDNPLMGKNISGVSGKPIIGLDLWEHAYYLKYKNKKVDYIKAFWNVINWETASEIFVKINKN